MSKKIYTDLFLEEGKGAGNRKLIIFCIALAILATLVSSIVSYYSYSRKKASLQEAKEITHLLSKIDKGNQKERDSALLSLSKMSRKKSAYSAIAGFHLAQLYIFDNEASKAVLEYNRIAEDYRYPRYMRDCAGINAISLRLMYNMIGYDEALRDIDKLLSGGDYTFKSSALLLKSIIASKLDRNVANDVIEEMLSNGSQIEMLKALGNGIKYYNTKRAAEERNTVNQSK